MPNLPWYWGSRPRPWVFRKLIASALRFDHDTVVRHEVSGGLSATLDLELRVGICLDADRAPFVDLAAGLALDHLSPAGDRGIGTHQAFPLHVRGHRGNHGSV